MSDRPLDPRLPHRPDAGGFEPALGGPGRELIARHGAVLARLPAEMTAGLPPERVLWNLWIGALSGQAHWDSGLQAALAESSEFVRNRLPDDVIGAMEGPLRQCWFTDEPHGNALRHAIDLLGGCPDSHPQSAKAHRLLAELAASPSPLNDARTCLPAALWADRIRDQGGGALLRRAMEARPEYVGLLLDGDDDEIRRTWDPAIALAGGTGRAVLGDISAVLERWYRNCPPGAPADAGVRVPFGVLGGLHLVPGLPLLRVALERLSGAAQWKAGMYDATRPLVQAVRRAVWIDGETPADVRNFLRKLDWSAGRPVAPRQGLIRLALSNPLFRPAVEAVLDMPGLGTLPVGDSGFLDGLPPAILRTAQRPPAAGRVAMSAAHAAEVLTEAAACLATSEVERLRASGLTCP